MFDSNIHKVPMDAPDDVEGLAKLIDNGEIDPNEIVGMLFSVEGDPYVGSLVLCAFTRLLSEKLGTSIEDVLKKMPIQICRGLTGLMVPHVAVFTRKEVPGNETEEKRLIIVGKTTKDLPPEDMGTMAQVKEIARVVRELMQEAGIEDPKDVKLVYTKSHNGTVKTTPGYLSVAIQDAAKRGKKMITENVDVLGSRIRGAGALGVGVALGEIDETKLSDEAILKDMDHVYTMRGISSSGCEHPHPTMSVVLFGNSTRSVSKKMIGFGFMKDGIDANGVKDALRDAGLKFDCCPTEEDLKRIEYVFLGSSLQLKLTIRGHRQTLMTDKILKPISFALQKAPVHAVAASLTGDPVISVSAAGEHMHVPGGCTVHAVVRTQ